jgi:hypothetical protein
MGDLNGATVPDRLASGSKPSRVELRSSVHSRLLAALETADWPDFRFAIPAMAVREPRSLDGDAVPDLARCDPGAPDWKVMDDGIDDTFGEWSTSGGVPPAFPDHEWVLQGCASDGAGQIVESGRMTLQFQEEFQSASDTSRPGPIVSSDTPRPGSVVSGVRSRWGASAPQLSAGWWECIGRCNLCGVRSCSDGAGRAGRCGAFKIHDPADRIRTRSDDMQPTEMPKPGPAHVQLNKLAGEWTGEEKLHPSPWDPAGGSAIGKVSNRVALDGFALVQHYEQRRDGQVTFAGHGVFWFDPEKSTTTLHWWDTMGGTVNVFTGGWTGDELAMTAVGPMGHMRCRFAVKGATYRFVMEVSPDGKQWLPSMEGTYRR